MNPVAIMDQGTVPSLTSGEVDSITRDLSMKWGFPLCEPLQVQCNIYPLLSYANVLKKTIRNEKTCPVICIYQAHEVLQIKTEWSWHRNRPCFIMYTRISSRQLENLNVKGKIIRLLKVIIKYLRYCRYLKNREKMLIIKEKTNISLP